MNVSVTIPGLEKLEKQFERAGQKLPDDLEKAMANATSLVKREAQIKVAKKTRALYQSILGEVKTSPLEGHITVNQPYGKFIEYGTKAHTITPTIKKALADKKAGILFGKSVYHPGTKAQPFMRPALEDNQERIKGYFQIAINQVVNRIKEA